VHVHLSCVKVPVDDGSNAKTVDGIEMGISFSGDLSEDRQQRLLEIAGRCPVHRILTSPVEIRTNLLRTSSHSVNGSFVGNDQRSDGRD
jgi:putative redox protein